MNTKFKKSVKRFLALALSLVLVAETWSGLSFTSEAATSTSTENGKIGTAFPSSFSTTPSGDYYISTKAQLGYFQTASQTYTFEGVTVHLAADIDWGGSAGGDWQGIGKSEAISFCGTFDGHGYSIKNLYSTKCGLFLIVGSAASPATITDFYVKNADITGAEGKAVVVSRFAGLTNTANNTKITDVTVSDSTAAFSGNNSGIIAGRGQTDSASITIDGCSVINTTLTCTAASTESNVRAYGLILARDMSSGRSRIQNCTVTSSHIVSTDCNINYAGCVVGLINGAAQVQNCSVDSSSITLGLDTTVLTGGIGAIVGYFQSSSGKMSNCTVTNTTISVSGKCQNVGLLMGRTLGGTFTNNAVEGSTLDLPSGTQEASRIGGMVGNVSDNAATFADSTVTGITINTARKVTAVGGILGNVEAKSAGTVLENISITDSNIYNTRESTTDYKVVHIGGALGRALDSVTLTNVDVTNVEMTSASLVKGFGSFTGYVTGTTGSVISDCDVKNSTITVTASSDTEGYECAYVSTFAGCVDSPTTISNCSVDSTDVMVQGRTYYMGGLIGATYGDRIPNVTTPLEGAVIVDKCSVTNVKLQTKNNRFCSDVAGLVGELGEGGTVTNSYVSGLTTVKNTNSQHIAGLIGYIPNNGSGAATTVKNCYVNGATLIGKNALGELIGNSVGTAVTIKNLKHANVTLTRTSGGSVYTCPSSEQVTDANLKSAELAWNLNTTAGAETNSLSWSQGTAGPIISKDGNQPAVRVTYQDTTNGNVYRYTNAQGYVEDVPAAPTNYEWTITTPYFTTDTVVTSEFVGGDGNTEVTMGTLYNANLIVKTTSSVDLMSKPWTSKVNTSSTLKETVATGTTLLVNGLYKTSIGEYWYKVNRYGVTSYVPAKRTTLVSHKTGDVKITDAFSPASLGYGKSFPIGGAISSSTNDLGTVTVSMYPRTDITVTPSLTSSDVASNKTYTLNNSTVDYNLAFGSLAAGDYTYVVSAEAVSYYISDEGNLTKDVVNVILERKQCIVTDANNPNPVAKFGIDVSTWQPDINWSKASQEVDFAIFRASYSTVTDDTFHYNASECAKYGVPFGVYVYTYATTPAEAQAEAEHVCSQLRGYDVALPVYYDLEDSDQANLSASEKLALVKAFCTTVESYGYTPGIYTFLSWFNSYLTDSYYSTLPKWVAQIEASNCSYTGGVRMWQYSWEGSISGISGDVDCNFYYGEFPGSTMDTSYLTECTAYPSNLTVKTSSSVVMKKYPCTSSVNSSSTDLKTLAASTSVKATGVYKNSNSEYWYQVVSGDVTGYIPASSATMTEMLYDDVSVKDIGIMSNLAQGASYSIKGKYVSQTTKMKTVYAKVYSGENLLATPVLNASDTVNDKYYSLQSSNVDNNLTFGELAEGYYTYELSADVQNYYVSNGTLKSTTSNQRLYTKPFTVGSTTISHTHTAGTAVKENVLPTSYDSVVYCTTCNGEISRKTIETEATEVAVTGITLNKTSLTLNQGSTATLTATVTPSNATNKTVTWTSSKPGVATVSNGTVTGVSEGSAVITATAGSKSVTCTVTVNANIVKPTSITLNKTSLTLVAGDSATLTATVAPADTTNKTVTWTSNKTSVATVSNGTVTAVASGTATITATCGAVSNTCTVTVKPALQISRVGIALQDNIAITFKAVANDVDSSYTGSYIVATQELENGETLEKTIQGVKSSDGSYYEYQFNEINAKEVGDKITATIYAYDSKNVLTTGRSMEYSVKDYCMTLLGKTDGELVDAGLTNAQFGPFRTLLVDLLNYASEAQNYFTYKTGTLANADLTTTQAAYATPDSALDSLDNITNGAQAKIDNPTATWATVSMNLLSKPRIRLKFNYSGDISKVTLATSIYGGADIVTADFEKISTGVYYAYFDQVPAYYFDKAVDFTLKANGVSISNTLRTSVESYVSQTKDDADVGPTMSAMMKYGFASQNFVSTR